MDIIEQIAIAEARGELEFAALLADSRDVSEVVSEDEAAARAANGESMKDFIE